MEDAGDSRSDSVKAGAQQSLRDFILRADAESFVLETEFCSMNDFLEVQIKEEDSVTDELFTGDSNGNSEVIPDVKIAAEGPSVHQDESWIDSKEGFSVSCGICPFKGNSEVIPDVKIAAEGPSVPQDESWIDSKEGFSVSCGICPFKGKDTFSVINHMKGHRFKTHACRICSLVLSSSSELGRHLATHKKEVPHVCRYCHHGFFRLTSLQGHNCSKKPKLCQHCGEPFRSKKALKRHIRDSHRTEVPKKRHCPHCHFSCWSGPALNAHLRTHQNNNFLQCPHCTFQFSKVAALQSHLRIHRDEPSFVCPYCGIVFAKYGVVKLHMEIHKDRSVLKCQQCDYQTPSKHNLRIHGFRNHRVKDFSCPHCKYTTAVPLRYKMHILSHKGDTAKLHACTSCEYNTKYLWDLKRHVQSRHVKEPTYPCPHCDFVTATLWMLKKHAKKHLKKLPPPDFLNTL